MSKNKTLASILAIISCGLLMTMPVSAEAKPFDSSKLDKYNEYFSIVQDDPIELEQSNQGMLGDLNLDSTIDSNDLLYIKKYLLGMQSNPENADMNQDGNIDIIDMLTLKDIVIKQSIEQNNKKTICLDAGHYGLYNRSPGVTAYYESNMSWKLHLYLKSELESYGFNVITTRENQDIDKNLVERGQTSVGCDLFISIHSNAVGRYMNESTDFPLAVVLLPDDSTNIDEISTEVGNLLATTIENVMGTKQIGRTWTRLSEDDRNGDGILNDEWYGVMFGAKSVGTPAILLEHSFHTNTRSAKWLLNDDNLQILAKAESETIAEYFGLA